MNPTLRVKLRRDLRASWSRFVLMVVAVAVSLTVFGGLLSAWAAIGRETGGAYRSTEPASATIVLDRGVTPERMASLLAAARTRPGVREATGRTQFEGAVEVGGKVLDIPMQVFVAAADDPMRMVKFDLGQQGRWPPSGGEILLGSDSLGLLGVAVGDAITVQIGRYYLVMTVLVAAAATLIALAPSVWIGRTFLGTLLTTLGIRPVSLAAPWWAYAVILAAGLGLPPLMALPPLVKASRTTVRAAIDHHGTAARPGGRLVRLSRLPRLDRGLLMALRNTVRRPARFWLSTGLLAAAGAVFVAGMSLEAGADAVTQEQAAQRTWDVDVQLAAPAARQAAVEAARRAPGVTRVEGFGVTPVGVAGPRGFPVTWTYPDQGHGRITLTALPRGVTTFPEFLEGRRLTPGETGAVVLSQTARKKTVPGLVPGDEVRLFIDGQVTSWRVAGIVEERGGDNVYVTAEGLAAAQGRPQQVDRLRVFTGGHDERTRDAVAAAVRTALADAGIAVRSAASVSRVQAVGEGHMGPLLLVLLGIAVPLGVLGVIGLASTMSANVLDRTREFGIMHAIGARPRTVRRIVAAEGLLLAVAGCVAAVVPAVVLTWLLGAGLGNLFMNVPIPFRISALGAVIWVVLALLGAALATAAAAARASRLTVREALAYL